MTLELDNCAWVTLVFGILARIGTSLAPNLAWAVSRVSPTDGTDEWDDRTKRGCTRSQQEQEVQKG
jgi:hypothetical protein